MKTKSTKENHHANNWTKGIKQFCWTKHISHKRIVGLGMEKTIMHWITRSQMCTLIMQQAYWFMRVWSWGFDLHCVFSLCKMEHWRGQPKSWGKLGSDFNLKSKLLDSTMESRFYVSFWESTGVYPILPRNEFESKSTRFSYIEL